MKKTYVIDAARTPIGRYGGGLSSQRPDDLLALVIRKLLDRNPAVDPAKIEDIIAGAANQSGEDNRNVARMAGLLAGLPVTVAGNTVNRLCASGLQAIMDASRALACGDGEFIVAGGVESMTRAPFVMAKADNAWNRQQEVFDTTMGWRFVNQRLASLYHPYTMGETAENVAEQWQISRADQDKFALESQRRYAEAQVEGRFRNELIPVPVTINREATMVTKDEHPRETTLEKLAALKPAFKKEGTVTAGNSSGINDGAAAAILAGEDAVQAYKLKPLASIVSMAVAGVDPSVMGVGPVPAVHKALQRAKLSIRDIGLIELNEAFASQSLACMRALDLDPQKVNVNGGAIALGHPLGASGVRIVATLLHEMKRRGVRYGLATMCVGVGQGAAVIFEST
ncbi:thiolase family protein [Flavihumibacter petaseus]|uniref:acetyl-CoA C-acyltransferase n=1 Tax=Flavihumibacter petaseus NBRC 106054 TaxID=1220578 RepID=A0A0E9MVK2_9BACT|nr:acetyl-CoA C-acyltransferase [Flavihumibacter petaseus]GAO41513.1 beta-ketoadipyl-CoA thiolase [Flavihumibacter petaseus NBRC 106054]